ncbi:hypothetical protein OAO87_01655 [bacterium]|nr:hypothetical protein [bacterium]
MTVSLGENIHAGDVRVGILRFEDGTSQTTAGGDGGGASYDTNNRLNAAFIGGGNVSNAEFDYLNGVTSSIQTQLTAANATANAAQPLVNATNRLDAAFIGGGNVSDTEFDRLDGVTSAIQTQLDAKVEVPAGLGYAANNVIVRNSANNGWTHTVKGYGVNELGFVGNPISGVGGSAINLANGSRINNVDFIALNGAATASNASKTIITDGSGNLSWSNAGLVPARINVSANDVLTTDAAGALSWQPGGGGGGISCYFAGRPSDSSNTNLTDNGTFTQFTALTAFTGGNSSSGVSWSSGAVTLSTAGVYTVHYGLNVNSSLCKLKRCVSQLRNGNTVLANSYWSSEGADDPLAFHPSRGTWMGTLSANSSLQLWYNITVVDQTGSTRVLEYSNSAYGEYGGTYLYGFKIA